MNKTSSLQNLVEQLRHPLRLRVALSLTILAGWYFLFYAPLTDQIVSARALIAKERKRIAAARSVEGLRKKLAAPQGASPSKGDANDLIQHVMGRIRSSALKLVDLHPERPKSAGPYDVMSMKLTCEGSYNEIDGFLRWVMAESRLLRIDELSIAPAKVGVSKASHSEAGARLVVELTLNSLMEKSPSTNAP